ncbi:MAG: hypothetical protein KBC64_05700 [Simkaniaceae bacterium]|nr:hypothetical protein [Simkaniaceae bacterium]
MISVEPAYLPETAIEYIIEAPFYEESFIGTSKAMSSKASLRWMKASLEGAPRLKDPMGVSVGELQEQWRFPSDHLPIAMQFDHLNIASWNVLDSDYMDWVIEKNHQGLARSLIADEHVYIDNSKLTRRDLHTARLVMEMIQHPTKPRDIIALQECNRAFVQTLQPQLPSNYKIIVHHGDAFILNMDKFDIIEAKGVAGLFSESSVRSIQQISLFRKDNQEILHIINGHLPGDPTKPARFEFANYLAALQETHVEDTIIAMGDMNFNEVEMEGALKLAYGRATSPYSMVSPYCTNISPYVFHSKAIDHFFIYNPEGKQARADMDPQDIMSELAPVHALLQGNHPKG